MLENISAMRAATGSSWGTYGGGTDSYAVLAHMLEVQIFRLDKSTPNQYQVFTGNTKGSCPYRPMSSFQADLELVRKEDYAIVVEFNGAHSTLKGPVSRNEGGHFAGYIPPAGCLPALPKWLDKIVHK